MNRNTLNWALLLGSIATLLLLVGVRHAETRGALAPDAPDADPENFVTGESMQSIALADGTLYWSTRDDCPGFEFLPICKVRSKPAGDGWSRTTYDNTDGARPNDLFSNVAADEQYIYWISQSRNVLRLMRYDSPTATPQVVAPLEDNTSAGEIAVDDQYVYWTENIDLTGTTSDSGKLFRAPKEGGARQEMFSRTETTLRQLQADGAGGALFITDTCGMFCFLDVLYRGYHNGSTFVTATVPDVLIDSFATDGSHVYWATKGYLDVRLGRAPLDDLSDRSEGPQLATSDAPDVPAMAVDSDNLYWHFSNGATGGPIFRLAKSAFTSGTPSALTANHVSVLDLVSNDRHLFWHNNNVIYRLPTDAAAHEIDASIADMEVTQGIQNLDNAVPLVHDRWTMVRVYPGFSSASLDGAGATIKLYGTRGGSALPNSPLTARHINAATTGYDRDLLDDSANFVLPSSWLEGDVNLRAEISVFGLHDTNAGNNSRSVNVSFTPKSNICVKFLPLETTVGLTYYVRNLASGNFTPGFNQIVQRFHTLWPAANVPFYTQGLPLRKPCFLCAPNPPFNMVEDKAWVIHALWEHNVFDEAPDWCERDGARTHYVGMVHPGVDTGNTGGYARLYEPLSWVKMTTGDEDYYDYHNPHAGGVMAQEIGHNHNGVFGDRWAHVDCGLPDGDDPYDGYPYDPRYIGPLGPRTYWGFDRMSNSIIQPDEASDYMSYCAPRWTSDHNWRGAMDATNNTSFMAPPLAPGGVGGDFILVTGIIAHDESEADLVATYRLPGEFSSAAPAAPPIGTAEMHPTANYALQLLSGSGAVLASHPVTPTIGTHHDHGDSEFGGDYNFITSVPDADGVATLRLTKDGAELTRRAVSANAPVVSNVTPPAGGHYTDTLPITWDASDADGGPLHYIVQYSPDDGASWQVVATGLTQTGLFLEDTGDLPGSEKALVRVIAGDGVNVGMGTSGSFSLEPHAPLAIIDAPADGQAFAVDEPVVLEGTGLDMEDGLLTGTSLVWYVTGPASSSAASGDQLTIHNGAPGVYSVQLVATDSDGMEGTAESSFVISPKRVYDGDTPHLDGYCDDGAYGNEQEPLSIFYGLGDAAMVRFVRAGGHVYVCFSGLQIGTNATQYAGLKVDVDNSGGEHMNGDDRLFYVRRDGLVITGSGDGAGSETYDAAPQGLSALVSETDGLWNAEMRIDATELGGWNHMVRLQAGHYDRNYGFDNRVWPLGSAIREPDAWGLTALGRQAQSISFPAPPDMPQEDGPAILEASSSSGLPVSFVSLTPDVCVTGGSVVDLLAAGQCQIRASQPGNGSYLPAADVTRTFDVLAAQGHPSLRLYLPILRR